MDIEPALEACVLIASKLDCIVPTKKPKCRKYLIFYWPLLQLAVAPDVYNVYSSFERIEALYLALLLLCLKLWCWLLKQNASIVNTFIMKAYT